jgi:hypothetical protein
MWGIDFEPAAPSCAACIEGVRFGGFDPFNPVRSFCECSEGMRLAGVTEGMLNRAGVEDGERTIARG